MSKQHLKWVSGPLLFLLSWWLLPATDQLGPMTGIGLWMIAWWVTEVIPMGMTALIPLVFFPLFGVMPFQDTLARYYANIVQFFFGGFVIAIAVEKYNLHKRVALGIMRWTGVNRAGILAGFMGATFLLSMWISNTATTLMMLPMALSMLELLREAGVPDQQVNRFQVPLLLSLAYAANIGGTATLIGTPPNMVLLGVLQEKGLDISFTQWMIYALPFALLMGGLLYWMALRRTRDVQIKLHGEVRLWLAVQKEKLGRPDWNAYLTTLVFGLTAACWIGKGAINKLLPQPVLTNHWIALGGAAMVLILPFGQKGHTLVAAKDLVKIPWNILLIFGGGLALARGLEVAHIVDLIAQGVVAAFSAQPWILILGIIIVMLFLTEFMSNVALTTVFIPVVIGICSSLDLDVLALTIPVTLAASCAFMMPISTPPNAIVFSSGKITLKRMASKGFALNWMAVGLLFVLAMLLM